MAKLTRVYSFCSLLGIGYSLDEIVNAAEETKKIRKSRVASMKGHKGWEKLRVAFETATGVKMRKSIEPKILAAKSG